MQLYMVLAQVMVAVTSHCRVAEASIDLSASLVWGPGLRSDFYMPVRYFYIQLVRKDGSNMTESEGEGAVAATVSSLSKDRIRIWTEVLDWHDGSYLVRYRMYSSTSGLQINVLLHGQHIAQSPYYITGNIYHETCNCPAQTLQQWAESIGCPSTYPQIQHDLKPFVKIDMEDVAKQAMTRFNMRGSHSICHYKIVDNKVYRKCSGDHVGFNMFSDAVLLSLTRKMILPDFDFINNLGDWPLEGRLLKDKPIPIISWCGSTQTHDIILPTYDITEATLQMMARVSLDTFSVQANTGPKWENKTEIAFWRGRDSRRERLKLVEMSRKHPDLIDARLTFMFFFPQNETKYGELSQQVSFYDFFKYKYQLNIDGTVAAYRLPYLLAGDAVVFKQESGYYEHFYAQLEPNIHYVPIKRDLSDLLEKILWAREHDEEVRQIARNGQTFAREHLTPAHVLCYHVRLFEQYAKRLKKKPRDVEDFDLIEQPKDDAPCLCSSTQAQKSTHEEL